MRRLNVLSTFSGPLYGRHWPALLFPRIICEHHGLLTNFKGRFCLDCLLLAVPSPFPMLFAPVSSTIMLQYLTASVFLMHGPGSWSLLTDLLFCLRSQPVQLWLHFCMELNTIIHPCITEAANYSF